MLKFLNDKVMKIKKIIKIYKKFRNTKILGRFHKNKRQDRNKSLHDYIKDVFLEVHSFKLK